MAWYWVAILGGLAAAGLLNARPIMIGFREGGLQVGLGAWLGYATFTVPIFVVGFWLGKLAFG